jgi:hypothetical protein
MKLYSRLLTESSVYYLQVLVATNNLKCSETFLLAHSVVDAHHMLIVQSSCYVWNVNYIVDLHLEVTCFMSWNDRLLQLSNLVYLNFFDHGAPCAKVTEGIARIQKLNSSMLNED